MRLLFCLLPAIPPVLILSVTSLPWPIIALIGLSILFLGVAVTKPVTSRGEHKRL